MEKSKSDSWKKRIEKEFANIARERADADAFWQRIKNLDRGFSQVIETKGKKHEHGSIFKRIKEKVLPSKKTGDDKRKKLAEIQRERMKLEKKREELRRKREELEGSRI
jgi:hypothetical protein